MSSPFQYFKNVLPLIVVAIPSLLLDIVTKWLVRMHIPKGGGYPIIPGFLIYGMIETQVLLSGFYQISGCC